MKRRVMILVVTLGAALAAQEPSSLLVVAEPALTGVMPGLNAVVLPGLITDNQTGLSFAEATEIVRGNQSVLQSLRERDCRANSDPSCGADLPVRARKALDFHDDLAEATVRQLAEVIRQAADAGSVTSVVFASSGLPFRVAPRNSLQTLAGALRATGVKLLVMNVGATGAGARGLARLMDSPGVRPFQRDVFEREAAVAVEPAKPPPPVVVVAMKHAATFAAQAATLLADEHYIQEVKTRPSAASLSSMSRSSLAGITIERRVLDSEVALIHVIAGELWLLARDVTKIDGKPLDDSLRVPLPAVHPNSTPDAVQQFRKIAGQGARFNIGGITRDLNVPTLALWLLTPGVNSRFAYSEAGRETIDGVRCDVIRFKERHPPYLFTADGRERPVSGRYWVDHGRSAVIRTELILEGQQSQRSTSRAYLTVNYAFDKGLSVWVPQTMTERYDAASSANFVTGAMTYTNYRQFAVSSRIVK